jgi:methyl-accepting chemotaxis protein
MRNRAPIKSTNPNGRQLLAALRTFRKGNFSVRLPIELIGLDGEIADAFNDVIELNERMCKEIERLRHIVGEQGKIGYRAKLTNATGAWAANIDMVNDLVGDMAQPTGEMARVISAVAKGDLSQTMNLEIDGRALRGEFLRTGKVVNAMLEQLRSFVSEVTRVAREVGTKESWAAKPRWRVSPAPGRTSPTT